MNDNNIYTYYNNATLFVYNALVMRVSSSGDILISKTSIYYTFNIIYVGTIDAFESIKDEVFKVIRHVSLIETLNKTIIGNNL
jgi:hypothetical protein